MKTYQKMKAPLRLNIQHFAETDSAKFNPDNVVMSNFMEGEIPTQFSDVIVEDVMANSVTMQLAQYEEMTQQKKEFTYLTGPLGAYWVGEGKKIQTSKPTVVKAVMEAHKLGVIVLATREALQYTVRQFFTQMRPHIAKALYTKFDEAAILNVDNPFLQSLDQAVRNVDNHVISGPINGENYFALTDAVNDEGFDVNAFISKKQNKSLLRNVVDGFKQEDGTIVDPTRLYNRNANTLDGLPIAELDSKEMAKGTLYAGDFNYLRYGIPFNLNFKITDTGQISTITDENGDPINLFEREMVAMRATMDVGFMVLKDEAFAKLEPAAETPEAPAGA
ncbi:phage major capsid protein [Edaphobacillus lindanitolerans]|uniref:phage major capsid protein n=1 Tax=Edaphobacillus lindanitolerans TaxID=550447 RepID=UPI003899647E